MQSLVIVSLAALKAALVGPLRAPVIIVVHTLPGLRFAQTVPCDGQKASVSSRCNEMKHGHMVRDPFCATKEYLSRASIIALA